MGAVRGWVMNCLRLPLWEGQILQDPPPGPGTAFQSHMGLKIPLPPPTPSESC